MRDFKDTYTFALLNGMFSVVEFILFLIAWILIIVVPASFIIGVISKIL
tara:strand:+ start:30 stop:176 length:147 start_codon:yes stop_codon:yes gene_type:complete